MRAYEVINLQKTREELNIMNEANKIVHDVLDNLASAIKIGINTMALSNLAEDLTKKMGATPAFKGYRGYPASLCVSINDGVVHGIPDSNTLKDGDIVSVDFGVCYKGFYGDAARTYIVGKTDAVGETLVNTTYRALLKGVSETRIGKRVSDISHAIQVVVEDEGFSVVREYVGHGIGKFLHEDPPVPNFGMPDRGPRLLDGMVLAIEPMVNEGSHEVKVDEDGWSVRTKDGKRSAHFEYSVAITETGPWILGVDKG